MDLETLKTCLEILTYLAALTQYPWLLLGVTIIIWGYIFFQP